AGAEATVASLAQVPPEEIHRVQRRPLNRPAEGQAPRADSITPYAFVLDDDSLPRRPWQALRDGVAADVDTVFGFNRDEYTLFTLGRDLSRKDPARTAAAVGLDASAVDDYRAAHPGIGDADLHTLLLTDSVFRMPALWCAEAQAEAGGRSHLYELTWESPAMDGALGACHALDLPLTFGNLDTPLTTMVFGESVPDGAEYLSERIRTAWLSFARTGDPGWPAYDPAEALTRIWDVPVSVATDPVAASRRIWAGRG
ncbi:carboxylesterase/lipase family protein, partial [Saccharomonospora iraqiensis]